MNGVGTSINRNNAGFTIVELLIVVVVIAILAAITIVSYNGITNSAYDSSVKSDLATFERKYEMFKTNNPSDLYPYGNGGGGAQALDNIPTQVNKNAYDTTVGYNLLNCTSTSSPGTNYALMALSRTGKRFWVGSNSGGVKEYTGPEAWGAVSMCSYVLAGSTGNGAGWGGGIWRSWVLG